MLFVFVRCVIIIFYYIRASIIQVHLPIMQQRKRWIAPLFLYGYTSKLLLYSMYSWIYFLLYTYHLDGTLVVKGILKYHYLSLQPGTKRDTSLLRISKVLPSIYQTNMIWKIPNLFNWKLLFMSAYLRDIDYFSKCRLQEVQKNKRIYGQLQMCVCMMHLSILRTIIFTGKHIWHFG